MWEGEVTAFPQILAYLSLLTDCFSILKKSSQPLNIEIFIYKQTSRNIGKEMLTAPKCNINKLETSVHQ